MQRVAACVAALFAWVPLAATASEDAWVQVAFSHPHAPVAQIGEARALFADVNAARVRRGLPALRYDERLAGIALSVAREMALRHYFGHTDPNGVTFEDRLKSAGYRYEYAAENMALDRDEAHAHASLLRSPGHYANIVDPSPHKLGVAAVEAGDGDVFYVEEFSD